MALLTPCRSGTKRGMELKMKPGFRRRITLGLAAFAALTLMPLPVAQADTAPSVNESALSQTTITPIELAKEQQVLYEKLNGLCRSTYRRISTGGTSGTVPYYHFYYETMRNHKTSKVSQDSFLVSLPEGKVKLTYTIGKSKKTYSLTVKQGKAIKLKPPALKSNSAFTLSIEHNGENVPLTLLDATPPAFMTAEEALKRFIAAQYDALKAQFPLDFGEQPTMEPGQTSATDERAKKPIDEVIMRYIPAEDWNKQTVVSIDGQIQSVPDGPDAPLGVWFITINAYLEKGRMPSWYSANGYLLIHNGESKLKKGYVLIV